MVGIQITTMLAVVGALGAIAAAALRALAACGETPRRTETGQALSCRRSEEMVEAAGVDSAQKSIFPNTLGKSKRQIREKRSNSEVRVQNRYSDSHNHVEDVRDTEGWEDGGFPGPRTGL